MHAQKAVHETTGGVVQEATMQTLPIRGSRWNAEKSAEVRKNAGRRHVEMPHLES